MSKVFELPWTTAFQHGKQDANPYIVCRVEHEIYGFVIVAKDLPEEVAAYIVKIHNQRIGK